MMNELADQRQQLNRNGKALRASKQSAFYYTTDYGGNENENLDQNLQQRSISLTALHTGAGTAQQQQQQHQLAEPRMAHLETLEAKMASIEVSLSASPRRKKGSSLSGGIISTSNHRNRDFYKELDSLRHALQDKEYIIQTLKGQLCNNLSSRLALRNGVPPLTEADRKATEERLQRLKRDSDNKKLAIKNLKLALERLDITDNIDVRIQQAELEYRLGREELELLTFREESRALQTAIELAETQEKQKNDTIYSCITGSTQITIHAIEVSADPKSPRFGAGPREDAAGLYVDWAVEDSGLCKGDRILEVNGKLVVGAGRSDLARLLAVAPDAAQIVVLRKNESLAALRTLRSDNLRLTHRISYLEEQVRDLLAPRTELTVAPLNESPSNRQEHVQIFQKGPQVTLVSNVPGLSLRGSPDTRQNLPGVKASSSSRGHGQLDYSSTEALAQPRSSRSRHKLQQQGQLQSAKSTASLDLVQQQQQQQQQHYPLHHSSMLSGSSPRRRAPRIEEQIQHKGRKQQLLQSLDFDSEPTYYRMQDRQSRTPEHLEAPVTVHSSQEYGGGSGKSRPAPPKKPLRLSLHRATSLQSVESAPPSTSISSAGGHYQDAYTPSKKPTKRNYRGDPPLTTSDKSNGVRENGEASHQQQQESAAPPPPPRTPSRAESCQSALRWPSPKPKPHLPQLSLEKWC